MSNDQRTVFLHIGWHKTGSSAIQKMLRKNEELLKESAGILFPETGRKRNAHNILAHSLFYSNDGNTKIWDELRSELEQTSEWTTAVISTESLDRAREEHIRKIFESMSGEWSLKAICYIRPPDEFLESSFSGKVEKGSYLGSWQNFREEAIKNNYPNYSEVISLWNKVLGNKAVIARPYDSEIWKDSNLFADFFATLGHADAEKSDAFCHPGRINTRSGLTLLSIIREVTRNMAEKGIPYREKQIKKHLYKKSLKYDDGKPVRFFSHQERIELRQAYASELHKSGVTFSEPVEYPENSIHTDLPAISELPNVEEMNIQKISKSLEEFLTANREDTLRILETKKQRREVDKKLQGKQRHQLLSDNHR